MFDANSPYDGTWRDIETGVDAVEPSPRNSVHFMDGEPIPKLPIYTRFDGPNGSPWWDGEEDPVQLFDAPFSPNPLPWSPNEDVGGEAIVAAYEGAYRTRGPVQAWGLEPSGGLFGEQARGLIMRFPANIPERFDPYGVWNTDPRDDLAGAMAVDELPYQNNVELTTNLLQWPNVWGRY